MEQLKLPAERPFATFKAELDGASYIVRLEWNMRCGWFIGLSDQDGVVIFSPKRMVPNWDLLGNVTDARRPRGQLVCFDTTGAGDPPGYDDLDKRHLLVYVTEAEKLEIIAEATS